MPDSTCNFILFVALFLLPLWNLVTSPLYSCYCILTRLHVGRSSVQMRLMWPPPPTGEGRYPLKAPSSAIVMLQAQKQLIWRRRTTSTYSGLLWKASWGKERVKKKNRTTFMLYFYCGFEFSKNVLLLKEKFVYIILWLRCYYPGFDTRKVWDVIRTV
jgi:hypothetical protein